MNAITKTALLFCLIFSAQFSNSQNNTITLEQKTYLLNTWYESPKESSENVIVYSLTEHVVVIGEGYFAQPGKITFTSNNMFTSDNLRSCKKDIYSRDSGKWRLSNQELILEFEKETCTHYISELTKDKLVIKIK